jgi:hypothetical protein
MAKREKGWFKAGTVGVDAGLVWVGDPCYVMGDDASHRVRDWSEFCRRLDESHDKDGFSQPLGPITGVVVSSGYGDGEYPVMVARNRDGRVAAALVVFTDPDDLRNIDGPGDEIADLMESLYTDGDEDDEEEED